MRGMRGMLCSAVEHDGMRNRSAQVRGMKKDTPILRLRLKVPYSANRTTGYRR